MKIVSRPANGNPSQYRFASLSAIFALELLAGMSATAAFANSPVVPGGFPPAHPGVWQSNQSFNFNPSHTSLSSSHAGGAQPAYLGLSHTRTSEAVGSTTADTTQKAGLFATILHSSHLHSQATTSTASSFLVGRAVPTTVVGPSTQSNRTIATDLGSSAAQILLTSNLFQNHASITLELGGASQSFSPGQKVTAAEYVAIKQVLTDGQQSLKLSATGIADGGSFNVNLVSTKSSELVIPANVTALDNFSSGHNFAVVGDIYNYGSIQALAPNGSSGNVGLSVISAKDLINEHGGLIVGGGDLTLVGTNSVVNAGTIGGAGVVNITADSGLIVNSGAVNAAGNINLNSAAASALGQSSNLIVNASGGSFNTTGGNVNLHDFGYSGTGNVTLSGGNYLAGQLNINAGQNAINGTVGNISGVLNTVAGSEHLNAAAATLTLGSNTVDGDPTFVNTMVGGGIVISGVNTFTQSVAILANGDISTTNAGQIVDNGGNVTIIAGAKTDTTGTTTNMITGGAGGAATQNVTVTLNPTVSNGGNINFSANAASTVIDTSSTTKNAGNVLLIALASNGGNGGSVLLGNSGINASTTGVGTFNFTHNGGSVTIYAGANPTSKTDTVTVGTILTGAGYNTLNVGNSQGQSGAVNIFTQQAKSSAADGTVGFDINGNLVTNKIVASGLTSKNAGVTINGDINTVGTVQSADNSPFTRLGVSAGAISITAGGDIKATNLLAYGTGGSGGASPDVAKGRQKGNVGGNGAPITLNSEVGDITISGVIDSSGGGGGGGAGRDQASKQAAGAGGAGGTGADVSVIAKSGQISVGAVYAADGGQGGSGGQPANKTQGGGGGGGGSYGGGGGGGGDTLRGGGGGGGGYFGGGGGGNGGGAGGSSLGGGIGGAGGGNAGTANTGGNGANGTANNGGIGGTLGIGGSGAGTAVFGQPGGSGASAQIGKASVILNGAGGVASTTGGIVGGTVTISTTGAGDVSIGNGLVGFSKATITTVNGDISETAGSMIATALTLTSSTGNIGVSGASLQTLTGLLSVGTGSGGGQAGVFITNGSAVTVAQGVAVDGTFALTANNGPLMGNAIVADKATITAPIVQLGAPVGSIDVLTQTHDLTVSAAQGAATIANKGTLSINATGSSASRGFTLRENATSAQFDSAVVTLNGSINGGSGTINISEAAEHNQLVGIVPGAAAATLTGAGVILNVAGAGDIGTSANLINTTTGQLTISTRGNVYVNNLGNVTLTNSSAGPGVSGADRITFQVIATADANGNGQITIGAGGIKIAPINKVGSITQIFLTSSESGIGKGGIVEATGGGAVSAGIVILNDGTNQMGTGSFGTDAAPLKINANIMQSNTAANSFVVDSNTGVLQIFNSTLSNTSTFALTSTGSIDGAGLIIAGKVILAATSIGTDAKPVILNADNVTLQAGKSVVATEESPNAVNLISGIFNGKTYNNEGTVSYSLEADTSPNLNNQQALKSGAITLIAPTVSVQAALTGSQSITLGSNGTVNGTVSISFPITAPLITLSNTSGSIVQQAAGVIKATNALTINLTNAVSADLRNAANDFAKLNDNVVGTGQVLLKQVDPVILGNLLGANQTLAITYTGILTTTAPFSVVALTFTPNVGGKNDAIKIGGLINASSNISLTADGTGSIQSAGLVGTALTTLTTGAGDITLTGSLGGQQVTLVTAGGSITQSNLGVVSAPGGVVVNLTNGGGVDLSKANNVFSNFTDTVVGTAKVNIATSTTLVLGAIMGAGQSFMASSGDVIVAPATVIEATSLSLTAAGAGGIGNPVLPIMTNASTIALIDNAAGANVFAGGTNANGFTLLTSSAGANLTVTSAAGITTGGVISGNGISLQSGGAGGITVGDKIGGANSAVSLTATGTGTIATKAANDLITGQTVTIASNGGSIAGVAANATSERSQS